ncbi:MAG TPA: ABC transporter ATP-binding protein [Deltaproteobacteria bacterium]|nr:ABC transporter ATP-binding protein [Deltaproteobacteria bacterium]MBW2022595.1 ABC transporter ATP-binding protein [Deltaproteobacteria bacterium]MBW2082921.1 ABC transporter ATP-binding protein [Deltaproteobacteria bacterium]HDZ91153.1 ABC transporter ATP-binding protein [Deltaproteobacteria bacterium]
MERILEIEHLSVHFPINIGTVRAVDDVNWELRQGEVMGLVGESGCGKSTLGFSILRLLRPPGKIVQGRILYKGRDIVRMPEREILELRGKRIAMIFQDPLTSLNPLFRIDQHFIETLLAHEKGLTRKDAYRRAEEMLESLGISPEKLTEYPHQLSGGMRQRIMIGLGLILGPDLLIADEPTTALDVIVEAQFLDLLADLQKRYHLTIILITHNLGNVAQLADRITVMYGGSIAEVGEAGDIFENPLHPYTQGLLASIPNIKLDQPKLKTMPGSPPDLVDPPQGCVFHPRCPHAMEVCRVKKPGLVKRNGRLISCWLYG